MTIMTFTDAGNFLRGLPLLPSDIVFSAPHNLADVTVVAANYNNGVHLPQFIASIINSKVLPREIVVVDDGSTDNSRDVLVPLERRIPMLRVILFDRNRGFANALNAGIDVASGRYIARVDPDDIFSPDRLRLQLLALEKGDCDIVGSNAYIFESGSLSIITQTNFPVGVDSVADRIRNGQHGVLHPTVIGRASIFKRLLYRQENVPAEDYDIFARALVSGSIINNLKEPLLYYRTHANSVSSNLNYSLIRKTYDLRDAIFGTHTPVLSRTRYFLFISSYRRYLYNKRKLLKGLYGVAAVLLDPPRALRRLRKGHD